MANSPQAVNDTPLPGRASLAVWLLALVLLAVGMIGLNHPGGLDDIAIG